MVDRKALCKILDLARWAPSGDNTQPWRFEIVADDHIAIHGHDTREWCIYDFDGHASHMAHGALLETLRIAATGFGLRAEDWTLRHGCPDSRPIYDVILRNDPAVIPSPLLSHIETRSVQRRAMETTKLKESQRIALRESVGPGYTLELFESFVARHRIAALLWNNAYIRLTCPEAYQVHSRVIEWNARYSIDRIPERAIGVDPITARLMRWVMKDWARVQFFNRYLMGTVAPRLQLDYLPALRCAAHLLLWPERPPERPSDYVCYGESMQRLWLTASMIGLHLQPEMTPVIFFWYAQSRRQLSSSKPINLAAARLAEQFIEVTGLPLSSYPSFMCRVGVSKPPAARSSRLPLEALWAT